MSRARRAALMALLLAGCAGRAREGEPAARAPLEDFGLPPVRAALEFPPGTSAVTLGWLVDELARLSHQDLALTPDLRRDLDQLSERLEQTAPVPSDEVYPFVEALLWRQGVLIAPVTGGERPVLGVYGRPEPGEPRPVAIQPAQVAALARHPALLCRVLLVLENLDARQIQTQLRQLFADPGPLQKCVAVGEGSLLIEASGAKVGALVELLQTIDRSLAGRPRTARAPGEGGEGVDLGSRWPTRPRTQ
ncbi:MAG TPA: hypothetical protein VF530_15570 [Planctomycetota bacterium]